MGSGVWRRVASEATAPCGRGSEWGSTGAGGAYGSWGSAPLPSRLGMGITQELGERPVTVAARNGDHTGVGGAPPRGHAGTVFRLVGYAGTDAGMAGQEAGATMATFILATHQG